MKASKIVRFLIIAALVLATAASLSSCSFISDLLGRGGLEVVYDDSVKPTAGDDVESLRPRLTVYVLEKDGGKTEVTDYTLSGELKEGASEITVKYGVKTAKLIVSVAPAERSLSAVFDATKMKVYTSTDIEDLRAALTVSFTDSLGVTKEVDRYTLSAELNEGEQTVTVSYGQYSTTFKVKVIAVVLESIEVSLRGGDYAVYPSSSLEDLRGVITVKAVYNDGNSVAVKDYTLSGTLAEGECVITAAYGGKSADFTVNVSPDTLTSIDATITQGDTVVYEGDPLDVLRSLITVVGHNSDGSESEILAFTLTGELTAGISRITVSVGNKTDVVNVYVTALVLQSVSIATLPDKTRYVETDEVDLTGLVIHGHYNNGTIRTVTDFTAEKDTVSLGDTHITVTVSGFTLTVPISVDRKAVELAVETMPLLSAYAEGQRLDLEGLVILVKYLDGSVERVRDFGVNIPEGEALKRGDVVTVSRGGITLDLPITVDEYKEHNDFLLAYSEYGARAVSALGKWSVVKYVGVSSRVAIPEECDGMPVVSLESKVFESFAPSLVEVGESILSVKADSFLGCEDTVVCVATEATPIGWAKNWSKHCAKALGGFEYTSASDFSHTTSGGEAYITGITGNARTADTIIVPERINGYPVVSIEGITGISATTVILPESLTVIADYAFQNCDSIKLVCLGSRVQTIGVSAFQDCDSLTGFIIPDSVTHIDSRAFNSCDLITSISLPASVKTVKAGAFANLPALNSVKVEEGSECFTFRDGVLYGNGLSRILVSTTAVSGDLRILDGVTEIDENAFAFRDKITSVTLPEGLTKLGSHAFYLCTSLESINLPSSLERTGSWAFDGCTALRSVDFSEGLRIIAQGTFRGCSALRDIDLPTTLLSISGEAFKGCVSLSFIVLPKNLGVLGDGSFYECYKLTSVWNKSAIQVAAIANQSGEFGYLGDYAMSISREGDASIRVGDYTFAGVDGSYCLTGYFGSDTVLTLPESVEGESYYINQYAFYGMSDIREVIIPDGVTGIGKYAFHGCDSLWRITLGKDVNSVGSYAFQGCNGMYEVVNNSSLSLSVGSSANGYLTYYADLVSVGESKVNAVGDFIFASDGKAELVKYIGTSTDIVLPESYNGGSYKISGDVFAYNTRIRSVIIPDAVTSLGAGSFYGCTALESVTLGKGIKTLTGFAGCTSLESIIIPDSVTEISEAAFEGSGLTSIVIPDGVIRVVDNAFRNCKSLESVTLGTGITIIEDDVFYGCSSLTSVELTSGLEQICQYAFYGCSSLTGIAFPETLTEIKQYAFAGCSSLTSVELPDSLKLLYSNVFENCTSLTSVTVGSKLTGFANSTFYGCISLERVALHDAFTDLGSSTFYGCTSLVSLVGKGVTKMRLSCFEGCTALESVTLSDKLESIPEDTFRDCNSLSDFVIPAGVKSIGQYAFYNCSSLKEITVPAAVTSLAPYVFYGCRALERADISGVTLIGNDAFNSCSSLKSVSFSPALTSIGTRSFYGCSSIVSLVIPEGITKIQSYAFGNCASLTSVTLPSTLTSIESSAFYLCYSLAEVVNGSKLSLTPGANTYGYVSYYAKAVSTDESRLEQVGDYLFLTAEGTAYLVGYIGSDTVLTLPESYNGGGYALDAYALYGFDKVTEIVIPASVTSIAKNALKGCTSVKKITLPFIGLDSANKGVTIGDIFGVMAYTLELEEAVILGGSEIGKSAFASCTTLKKVTLPEGITSIAEGAFQSCRALVSVVIPESVTTFGNNAFRECTSLERVGISSYISSIGSYAFYMCSSLKEIAFADGDLTLGTAAFANCTAIEKVTFGSGNISFGASSFTSCFSLGEIVNRSSVKLSAGSTGNGAVAQYATLIHDGSGAPVNLDGFLFATVGGAPTLVGYVGGETELTLPTSYNGTDYVIGKYAFANSAITSLKIEGGVSAILDGAFRSSALERVVIEGCAPTLSGSNTFYQCSALVSVTLPDGMTALPNSAFSGCTSLTEIRLPADLTSIGNSAFSGCSSLREIDLPDSVKRIDGSAFSNCKSLVGFKAPASLTSVESLFSGLTALEWVDLHDGITNVRGAFQNCTSIKSVTLPAGITSIGDYTFSGATALEEVIIPEGVRTVGSYAFYGCTALKSIVLPKEATTLGSYAFYGCTALESITLPEKIKEVPEYTFHNCSSLLTLVIPEGVTTLGDYAFVGCDSLISITIPSTVRSYSYKAFGQYAGFFALAEVVNNSAYFNPDYIHHGVLYIHGGESKIIDIDGYLFLPAESGYYLVGYIGEEVDLVLPELPGGESYKIAPYAFNGREELRSVTAKGVVTEVCGYAFENCRGLTSVSFVEGLTTLGSYSFSNCYSLTKLVIPASLTTVNTGGLYANANTIIYFCGDRAAWEALGIQYNTVPILYNYKPE